MAATATQGGLILPVSLVEKVTVSKGKEGREIYYATIQIGYGSLRLPIKEGIEVPEGWNGKAYIITENRIYDCHVAFGNSNGYDVQCFRPVQIVRFDKDQYVGVTTVFDIYSPVANDEKKPEKLKL